MSDYNPAAGNGGGVVIPNRGALPTAGAFATSEVLPMMANASRHLAQARANWRELRDTAATAKAAAKATRANLIVHLRVWGNEAIGQPIKTSAERNEWADADAAVQQAELDADLAQSAAMDARAALEHAEDYFKSLTTMLGIERDEMKAERGAPN